MNVGSQNNFCVTENYKDRNFEIFVLRNIEIDNRFSLFKNISKNLKIQIICEMFKFNLHCEICFTGKL